MERTAKNKADRCTAAECRRLAGMIDGFMTARGFAKSDGAYGWRLRIDDRTELLASPGVNEDTGHPHLACRFARPEPRPDLPWDHAANHAKYADLAARLGDVNRYSGKWNCLVFERRTAEGVLVCWGQHLGRAGIAPGDLRGVNAAG